MSTVSDFIETTANGFLIPATNVWVKMHNNDTAVDYFSTGPSNATTGYFTFTALPGNYTVYTGPTASGPWTATGDTNYIVPYTPVGSATFGSVFLGSGDEIAFAAASNLSPYQVLEAVSGTAAAPNTTVGPIVKINQTQQILESQVINGATNEQTAALTIMTKATALSEVQASAGYFVSQNSSTQTAHNDDAAGLCATGRIIGAGTGYGIGAYFDGRRDNNTGHTDGIEVRSGNYGTVDGSFNPNGASDTMGVWITSGGTSTGGGSVLGGVLSGVAISMYGLVNTQWATGIGIPAGAVKNESFYDNSSSSISLKITGTHATAAIQVADAAGPVSIGTSVAQTPKFSVGGTYSDSTGANAIVFNPNHSVSAAGKQTFLVTGSVTLTAAVAGSHLYNTIVPIVTSNPTSDATKTLTTIYAQFARVDTATLYSANITTVVGINSAGSTHAGSGTIANVHHFRVSNPSAPTGTITTEIGLYIEALTRGGTNRSIYFAGNAGAVAPPVEFQNGGSIITDTTNGLTIGTGSTQKLGFYGATPVAQIAGSTDVLAGLVTQGFRAASSNPPLSLGTGNIVAGNIDYNDWTPSDHGFIAWNFEPTEGNNTLVMTPGGTVFVQRIHLRKAVTITNIHLWMGTIGNTLTLNQCLAGFYDSGGNLLSATGDQSVRWVGALGLVTMALSVAQPVAAGDYYTAFFYNGTTGPSFNRAANTSLTNVNQSGANLRFSIANTTQTTSMPSLLSGYANANAAYWVALS